MRRLTVTIVAVAAFSAICGLGLGCDQAKSYDTKLSVDFAAQPQGGLYVNTVTSTVTVGMISAKGIGEELDVPIQLKWAWHSPSGHYNDSSKIYVSNVVADQMTISKSAPSGLYLDKKFWLTLTWEDETGKHTVTSDTADCRVN